MTTIFKSTKIPLTLSLWHNLIGTQTNPPATILIKPTSNPITPPPNHAQKPTNLPKTQTHKSKEMGFCHEGGLAEGSLRDLDLCRTTRSPKLSWKVILCARFDTILDRFLGFSFWFLGWIFWFDPFGYFLNLYLLY